MRRPERAGFILPFVLLALAAGTVVILAHGTQAVRALRGASGAASTARVQLAAEGALATAAAEWGRDSVATRPLGSTLTRAFVSPAGISFERRWVRTAPDVAWLTIDARDGLPTGAGTPQAHLARALWLESPSLPLSAAITTTGALDIEAGSRVLASMHAPDSSGCAREPAPAVSERQTLLPSALPLAVTTGWGAMVSRALPWPVAMSDATSPTWRAARLRASDSVLTGPLTWHGLLVRDGALTLVGEVTVHGLLVVRGPFDARAAHLSVRGALVIADPSVSPVLLGGASTITWDRCRVQMALATVATPRSRPFFAWHSVTP